MKKMTSKTIIVLVSWYGLSDIGGLERVSGYLYDSCKDDYDIRIIDYDYLKKVSRNIFISMILGKHVMIDGFLFSCFVNAEKKRIRNNQEKSITITQGYNAPFVEADICIAHGVMRAFKTNVYNDYCWHINQLYEKFAFNNAKKVISVSSQVKMQCEELLHIDPLKIDILENCVDTDVFFPKQIEKKKPLSRIRVLFSGRLERRKGLDILCKFAHNIENMEEIELYIATMSEDKDGCFGGLTHTHLLHCSMDKMNDFYNEGDVMLFPSRYEAFEMVTTECLSAGCPVIGNKTGAIAELYNANVPGIYLIGNERDYQKDFCKRLTEIANNHCMYKDKQKLHEIIEKKYGKERYRHRILDLIKNIE